MKRFGIVGLAVALPLLSGCGSSSEPSVAPTVQASSTPTGPGAVIGFPCAPATDVIIRSVVPDLTPRATLVGGTNLQTCASTFDDLQRDSPKEPGYCTQAALASDNPGYDIDAEPAPPLRNVQAAIGPAC